MAFYVEFSWFCKAFYLVPVLDSVSLHTEMSCLNLVACDFICQRSHVVDDLDDDMDDLEDEDHSKDIAEEEEEEPEVIESDIELDDSEVVEPDNDPPQQVSCSILCLFF